MGLLIFQNDACMVINKLPGESSEFPRVGTAGECNGFAASVHRLDMPVSGCLLLARTSEAATFLAAAFARPEAGPEKRYWAIIEMPPPEKPLAPEGELVHLLRKSFPGGNRKANKSFAAPWEENVQGKYGRSKKAVLRYRVAGKGENYLFLEIDLVTGRHHQIRAQLAAMGLHIKGDLKYGARRSEKAGGIRLHAYSLAFPNPLNPAETIRVKALPPLMDPLWQAFSEAVNQSP